MCRKVIEKNELRIGKQVLFKKKIIKQYYHIPCSFSSFRRARKIENIIADVDTLSGYNDLAEEEKVTIRNLVEKELSQREKEPVRKIPAKKKKVLPSSTERIRRLIPSGLPSVSILFTNADQLTKGKMCELKQRIVTEKPLIIAISEIKSKSKLTNLTVEDYKIPGYTLHPINLDSEKGRGIAVYTHEAIEKSVTQISMEPSFEEACLLEVRLRGGDVFIFGCIYRSPTPSIDADQNNENLNRLLKLISMKNYTHRCIVGDFNYRDINWKTWSTHHGPESKESKFIECVRDSYLHQHVNEVTRMRGNDEPSTLDLVFTDEVLQVSDLVHHAPLGKSDHSVVTFKYQCYIDYGKPKEKYIYTKADWNGMKNDSENDKWEQNFMELCEKISEEDQWQSIKLHINYLKDKYVPKSKVSGNPTWNEKGNIPVDKKLREAIRNKHAEHRHWIAKKKRGMGDSTRIAYTKARNKVTQLMRKATRKFERSIALSAKENPKSFWAHIRRRMKTKSGIAPLLEDDDNKTSLKFNDDEKAEILQKQFTSVFTKEPPGNVPSLGKLTDASIPNLIITEEMVLDEILLLKISKSPGPDDIHPIMLVKLAPLLAKPLTFLFNTTLRTGKIPIDWKKAKVSPIFKKGAKNRAENYRPISLTSIVCKLMEKFVRQAVMDHLLENKLITEKQHGFLSGRSTVTQLLKYLDDCINDISNGSVVDSIYLDFSKAFDTVPHRRLMSKLESYGISGNVQKWILSFLSGRTQTVVVNHNDSTPAHVISGIPQGSVLGPLLFVIYINDLPDEITSHIYLFADDTKLSRRVQSKNDAKDLQKDLNLLEAWSKKWLLQFNPDKCHVLTIGNFENIRHTERYELYGNELEHVFEEKDLGVYVDSDLKFEAHIASKVNKANSIVGLIRRSFNYLDGELFKKLYISFVRPHLEYAQSVWQPHLVKYKNILENVQIRATKLVDGFSELPYEERLKKLDLPTLTYRRERGDMIEIYKHMHTYDKDVISQNFRRNTRISRKHNYQLVENKPSDGVRGRQYNSFYFRNNRKWNNLPKKVVDAATLDGFKQELDEAWNKRSIKFNTDL